MNIITNKKANQLLKMIENYAQGNGHFSIDNFLLNFEKNKIYNLGLKDNIDYYFEVSIKDLFNSYNVITSPPRHTYQTSSWDTVVRDFQKWQDGVEEYLMQTAEINSEMQEPDLWEEIINQSKNQPVEDETNLDVPFTDDERAQVKEKLSEIKVRLLDEVKDKEDYKEIVKRIDKRLDYLENQVGKQNKIVWRDIFISVLINLSIDTGLGIRIFTILSDFINDIALIVGTVLRLLK